MNLIHLQNRNPIADLLEPLLVISTQMILSNHQRGLNGQMHKAE